MIIADILYHGKIETNVAYCEKFSEQVESITLGLGDSFKVHIKMEVDVELVHT